MALYKLVAVEYFPVVHGVQVVAPVLYLPVMDPALQVMHEVFPVWPWYSPRGQLLQPEFPVVSWYCPAEHVLHASLPSSFWYIPTAQFVHSTCPHSVGLPCLVASE